MGLGDRTALGVYRWASVMSKLVAVGILRVGGDRPDGRASRGERRFSASNRSRVRSVVRPRGYACLARGGNACHAGSLRALGSRVRA